MSDMPKIASFNYFTMTKLVEIAIPFSSCFASISNKSKFDDGHFYENIADFLKNTSINYQFLGPTDEKKKQPIIYNISSQLN